MRLHIQPAARDLIVFLDTTSLNQFKLITVLIPVKTISQMKSFTCLLDVITCPPLK